MVVKMAAEGMRATSPPLPPDPQQAPLKLQTSRPPPVGQPQQQPPQSPPSTPSRRQTHPELKRVDSSRAPPPAPSVESPLPEQQQQPIKDAVNDAANNVFEQSPVPNQLDPEFIRQVTAQVTAQVLNHFQASGATATPTLQSQPAQFPPPPPPAQSQEARSPALSSVDLGAARYTPPTPDRTRDQREEHREYASSPEPPTSDGGSNFSYESRESMRSSESRRSADTPRPFDENRANRAGGRSYPSRRWSGIGSEREGPVRKGSESEDTARDRSRRASRESETPHDSASGSRAGPMRIPSNVEESPLEKFWQPLFDSGNPTIRLSQFLRGLALHIIEDIEPKGSLVVTPNKMLQFLNDTKIENEHYPWDIIFGGKLTPLSISMMYQKLQCQHHYTQERYDKAPTIPGLTTNGFDYFMTCLIQAHPDDGYERMAKAVMNMPISNADNKSERFPKELVRRLFPAEPNVQAQQRLIASLNHEPYVIGNLKGASAMPPPPPPPTSAPPSSFQERERKPYSQASQQSNAVDDDDLAGPPPVQIERERKPYTAKEGAGKTYGQEDSRPPPSSYKPEATGNSSRSSRTNSGMPPQAMYNSGGTSDPMGIPQRHRMSVGQGSMPPQPQNGGYSKSARRSSPPLRNQYARSESEFAQSQYSSQSRDQSIYPGDVDDDATKRYRSRSRVERPSMSNGNPLDDDPRGYPIPGRNVPIGNAYEYGTSHGPGPPIGQQVGSMPGSSYPTRRPGMSGGGNDDRRRSMYGAPTGAYGAGDGGTDGYGSFANTNNGGYHPPPPPPPQSYGSSSQH